MRERPILFSGPMVRAILDGKKTQTRRIINPQPIMTEVGEDDRYGTGWHGWEPFWKGMELCGNQGPFGRRGDLLWVRESMRWTDSSNIEDGFYGADLVYSADNELVGAGHLGNQGHKRIIPSIHMFREQSRISLEIINIGAQQLHEITEEDAVAEGVDAIPVGILPRQACWDRRQDFKNIWDIINGPDSWSLNPWVWVIEFKRIIP